MPVPEWADELLSRDLPVLRARGENQDLEYMESFPQQARDLGKEIAAFATSNQGTIILGVSNIGDLVGLVEGESVAGRDELLRRVEGVCRGTVKPAITPTAKFAVEDSKAVLVLLVPKGNQPVYYSNNVPYIRHITESRPAEPHEVVELFRKWLPTAPLQEQADPYSEVVSKLAPVLVDVLIYCDEAKDRMINPWLDMWRSQFQQAASDLRELAVDDTAMKEGLAPELTELANALDKVAHFRLYLGCGREFFPLIEDVRQMAEKIKQERIDRFPLAESSLAGVRDAVISYSRKLDDLGQRAEEMLNQARFDEFQSAASEAGFVLLKASHYDLSKLHPDLASKLRQIGRRLHLIETTRLSMDGGRSVNAMVESVRQGASELKEVAKFLGA